MSTPATPEDLKAIQEYCRQQTEHYLTRFKQVREELVKTGSIQLQVEPPHVTGVMVDLSIQRIILDVLRDHIDKYISFPPETNVPPTQSN